MCKSHCQYVLSFISSPYWYILFFLNTRVNFHFLLVHISHFAFLCLLILITPFLYFKCAACSRQYLSGYVFLKLTQLSNLFFMGLEQMLQGFVSTWSDSKYFKLYRPYGTFHHYSVMLLEDKNIHRQYLNRWCFYKTVSSDRPSGHSLLNLDLDFNLFTFIVITITLEDIFNILSHVFYLLYFFLVSFLLSLPFTWF